MLKLLEPSGAAQRRRERSSRLLIVGCGNPLRGDDGVGVKIARRLAERGRSRAAIRALPQAGLDLLGFLDEADIIVFLDAVTSGAPAGTLYLAELPHSRLEPRALGSLSGHGFGLAEALALAEALGRRLPRMILVGIEIADASPGCELSPAVERAGGRLVKGFARLESALQAGEAFTRVRRFAPGEEFLREE